MKRNTPSPLHRRLSLPEHVTEFLTKEETAHAEHSLKAQAMAMRWITKFKYDNTQAGVGLGYNAEFWEQHEKMSQASSALKGLRAVLRYRYSLTFEEGLFKTAKGGVWGRMRTGLHGRGRGRYLKRNTLLMWIERDEFGENWFMNLNDNKTIIAIKGAALQSVIPVPPEEDDK